MSPQLSGSVDLTSDYSLCNLILIYTVSLTGQALGKILKEN